MVVRWEKRMSLASLTASFTRAGSAALRAEASGRRHTTATYLRIRHFVRARGNVLPIRFILGRPLWRLLHEGPNGPLHG